MALPGLYGRYDKSTSQALIRHVKSQVTGSLTRNYLLKSAYVQLTIYALLSKAALPESIMSNDCDVLSPGRPHINHRSAVVVCQAQILMLAKISDVTVSISGMLFLFPYSKDTDQILQCKLRIRLRMLTKRLAIDVDGIEMSNTVKMNLALRTRSFEGSCCREVS